MNRLGPYVAVFAALLALTALTVLAAHVDLGRFNVAAALAIAGAKALLVALYFMHARHAGRLVWLAIGAGIFWFAILLSLSMADFATRSWLPLLDPERPRGTGAAPQDP